VSWGTGAVAWAALEAEASSLVWVAVEGRVEGVVLLEDELHPDSEAAIAELKKLGVLVRILSGDRHPAVSRLASRLKVKAYESELTPAEKLERVRNLVAAGCTTVMVGDGINDAPALAAASAGIAIGTGSEIAREAGDICLVGHSPKLIPETIRLARRARRVMIENLGWAVGYNVVMLPIAMFTPLPPGLAAGAMMFSSLSVVLNSLRLRRLV
jgi:P-type Cu+ transporter